MDISSWTSLRVLGVSLAWALVTFGIRWFQIWSAERRLRSHLSCGNPYSTTFVPRSVPWLLLVVALPVLLIATWLIVTRQATNPRIKTFFLKIWLPLRLDIMTNGYG